jgi:hypothetical protein
MPPRCVPSGANICSPPGPLANKLPSLSNFMPSGRTCLFSSTQSHRRTISCAGSFNDATCGDLEDWILSQERSRGGKGSVFTGPVFQESDAVYQGVKVPVAFYKVVAVVDDAKGQLSVTAWRPCCGLLDPDAARFLILDTSFLEMQATCWDRRHRAGERVK